MTKQSCVETKNSELRMLTLSEINKQDVFLCAGEDERISIRNLLKLLQQISSGHFEVCLKEMGYKKLKKQL